MLLWENNEPQSGVMKWSHCYRLEVDYFRITAHPEGFYTEIKIRHSLFLYLQFYPTLRDLRLELLSDLLL